MLLMNGIGGAAVKLLPSSLLQEHRQGYIVADFQVGEVGLRRQIFEDGMF